ncbi:MAG: hypothetical protein E7546_08530 [Ruminococcaceae bacterium]|nr:hypothetical protein [Oscillospiraceae bacterium]
MQSQDEKLGKFLQAINEYSEKQRQLILMEVEEQNRIELERAEKETLADTYRMISRHTADVRSSIARELSSRELSSRKALLEKRGAIEREVFEAAGKKLCEFVKTEDYAKYLSGCAKAAASTFRKAADDTVFRIRPEDMKYSELIGREFGAQCRFEEDAGVSVGGILALNKKLGLALDLTLGSRLEQQKEWFCETSGLLVC